ncbi:hypothetical protein FGIG_04027 [Fasciola gigantica]|uniref:Cilia-and flagella-associated protein 96 n=1 Tax=Fasciola gigantica TaxID=46835 RepID=A0A504YR50_FASGI|nr:hypothetical protein FGIG_04027 [Fasciola gigantica]
MRRAPPKPHLDRLGIFREMSYHTVNDPYKPVISSSGTKTAQEGRQMLSCGSKTISALSDGYFDSFKRIFSGDCRVDMGSGLRKQRMSAKKFNIGKDWIPASCLKKIDGSGSCYGTFSGPVSYFKPKTIRTHQRTSHLKNITTNPGKKCSYSYVDVGLTPYPKHITDPYDRIKEINAKEAATDRTLMRKKGPFYRSVTPTAFFDSNPFRSLKPNRRARSAEPIKGTGITTPFKPTCPSKSDGGCKEGCFDKFPSYMSGAARVSKATVKSAPIFHLSYGPLPYPTSSIITQNVKRAVNSANRKTIRGVVYLG